MRDSKEVKLIMVGNVNRGGKGNSDIHIQQMDYPLRLQPEHMDIV